MPDEIIVWERARSGDADSFGVIFDEHRDRVYGHALRLTRSGQDAEDVTALVFLEAWRRRGSVRLVDDSILAWLLLTTNYVAKNAARTARRHRIAMAKITPQEDVADHSEAILERFDSSGREKRLREAFVELSPHDRDVLTLCVVNDFTMEEAAAALRVPVGTVKSRLSRAKQRLAALTLTAEPTGAPSEALGGTK